MTYIIQVEHNLSIVEFGATERWDDAWLDVVAQVVIHGDIARRYGDLHHCHTGTGGRLRAQPATCNKNKTNTGTTMMIIQGCMPR